MRRARRVRAAELAALQSLWDFFQENPNGIDPVARPMLPLLPIIGRIEHVAAENERPQFSRMGVITIISPSKDHAVATLENLAALTDGAVVVFEPGPLALAKLADDLIMTGGGILVIESEANNLRPRTQRAIASGSYASAVMTGRNSEHFRLFGLKALWCEEIPTLLDDVAVSLRVTDVTGPPTSIWTQQDSDEIRAMRSGISAASAVLAPMVRERYSSRARQIDGISAPYRVVGEALDSILPGLGAEPCVNQIMAARIREKERRQFVRHPDGLLLDNLQRYLDNPPKGAEVQGRYRIDFLLEDLRKIPDLRNLTYERLWQVWKRHHIVIEGVRTRFKKDDKDPTKIEQHRALVFDREKLRRIIQGGNGNGNETKQESVGQVPFGNTRRYGGDDITTEGGATRNGDAPTEPTA